MVAEAKPIMLKLPEQPAVQRAADDFPPVEQRLANILAKLSGVHKRANGQYEALCNCHDDTRPSLGVRIGDNRGIVITCSKGCPRPMIMAALGYNMAYLRPDGMEWRSNSCQSEPSGKVVAEYEYRNAAGEVVFQKVRLEPKDFRLRRPDGKGGWINNSDGCDKSLVYRLPEVMAAGDSETIYLCEGEKAADACVKAGLVATCGHGGAHGWRPEHAEHLRGRIVAVLRDNDPDGEKHAAAVIKSLVGKAADAKVVLLPDLPAKGDAFDWFAAGRTADELKAIAAGVPAADLKPASVPLMTAGEFIAKEYRREFLIDGILVAGEPCIIGAPPKTLKTTIAVDAAIAIAAGVPFLGVFPTKRARVAMISGESGPITLQETTKRIAAARGVDLSSAELWMGLELPCLGSPDGLSALENSIKENKIEVLFIDPVYLSLMGDATKGLNPANLFDIGPLLKRIVNTCSAQNCTLILLHHTSKAAIRNKPKGEGIELSDLSMSGFGEFARQWVLLKRQSEYHHDGRHAIVMTAGGSAGHSGGWALDVFEGVLSDQQTARRWEVAVRSLDDDFEQRKQLDEKQAESKKQSKYESLLATIVGIVERYPAGQSTEAITNDLKLAGPKLNAGVVKSALMELERRRVVVDCDIRIPTTRLTKEGQQVTKAGKGWKMFGGHQQKLEMAE